MKLNKNLTLFFQENVFKKVVCEMAAILCQLQCVDTVNIGINRRKKTGNRISPGFYWRSLCYSIYYWTVMYILSLQQYLLQLRTTFIFERCHHSIAVVTSVIYEYDNRYEVFWSFWKTQQICIIPADFSKYDLKSLTLSDPIMCRWSWSYMLSIETYCQFVTESITESCANLLQIMLT